MKRKLLISTFVTALSLLNSSLIASDQVLDEMEKHVIHTGMPKCTLEYIDSFQRKLDVTFPSMLLEFWLRYGHVSFPRHSIVRPYTHIEDYINQVQAAYEIGVSKEWFPFSESDGNYYCIHLETGEVGYWDHYEEKFSANPEDRWKSFFDWIKQDWLFKILRWKALNNQPPRN